MSNSTPHSWRHKRACKALLDWYSDKQHALFLKNTLLESSLQKTRSPNFLCPCSRASSSRVQLHLDNRFLGNSNSPLIRTESESPGLTSYIYCKFNLENPKTRSKQCFVAPFLCISPMIPFTASDFTLCLSEIQSPNALRTSIFRQVCGALFVHCYAFVFNICETFLSYSLFRLEPIRIRMSVDRRFHNIFQRVENLEKVGQCLT